MQLDVRTSLFLISTGSLAISTAMIALSSRYTGHIGRAMSFWGNGLAMIGVGFVMYALHGRFPDFFSIVAANTLWVWGLFSRYFAVKIMKQASYAIGLPIFVTVLVLAFNLVFVYGENNSLLRGNINLFVNGLIILFTSIPLFMGVEKAKRATYWLTGSILVASGLALMARGMTGWLIGPPEEFVSRGNSIQNFALIGAFLAAVISSILFTFIAIDEYNFDLFKLATRDPLTNILNRRMLYAMAEKEVSRFRRDGIPLSLIVFDLDHFKKINDLHGHAVGDTVLMELTKTIAACVRSEDVFARFGGEEFCVLLPGTRKPGALALAEKLRAQVNAIALNVEGEIVPITASFGVATMESPNIDFNELMREADKAMYEAKHRGRNRVVVH